MILCFVFVVKEKRKGGFWNQSWSCYQVFENPQAGHCDTSFTQPKDMKMICAFNERSILKMPQNPWTIRVHLVSQWCEKCSHNYWEFHRFQLLNSDELPSRHQEYLLSLRKGKCMQRLFTLWYVFTKSHTHVVFLLRLMLASPYPYTPTPDSRTKALHLYTTMRNLHIHSYYTSSLPHLLVRLIIVLEDPLRRLHTVINPIKNRPMGCEPCCCSNWHDLLPPSADHLP